MLSTSRSRYPERGSPAAAQSVARAQRGVLLLEATIAIVIFSFGVLGLFGVLSSTIRATDDARLRAEAAFVANALVAQMWTMRAAELDSQFAAGGAGFAAWQARIEQLMPAATLTVDLAEPGLSTQSRAVVVTLTWLRPGSTERHRYVTSAQIGRNA